MDSTTEESEKVELAILSLPPGATNEGLEAGDGTSLILEATSETVDLMQPDEDAASKGGGEEPEAPQFHISAVVDLEKLSELVGVSEEDFISGLHQEVQDSRAAEDETAASSTAAAEADEETPLVPAQPAEAASTETDTIQLSADPFLESLAQVLPTVPEFSVLEEDASVAFTEAAATTTLGATEGDDDEAQHLAHDAFLLSVPVPNEDDPDETTKFVLALPEIQLVPASVQTEPSDVSTDPWFEHPVIERALSLLPTQLPSDIESVQLNATPQVPTAEDPASVHLDIVVERKVPLVGYVILFAGLVALASVGAALDLQQGGATAVMKTLWRQTATCCVLSPMVVASLRRDGIPGLGRTDWALLSVGAAAYTYMTLAFVLALEMTTLANAFVLSNMTSLVIIAARAALGLPVLLLEGAGAVIGFVGAAICAGAEASSSTVVDNGVAVDVSSASSDARRWLQEDAAANLALLGNLVALSASFGTAGYLLIAKNLRPKMDLMVFMFSIMGIGTVFLLAFSLVSGMHITFDNHPVHGFFGWINLQPDRLPLELYMAVVCNCLGTMGYIAVLKYFDAIVPATVMLLEPVVGAFLGTLAGTSPLPGLQTWLGDLVVAVGTFLVIRAGAKTTENIDATEALRPRLDGDEDDLKSLVSRSSMSRSSVKKSPFAKAKKTASGDASAKIVWDTSSKQ